MIAESKIALAVTGLLVSLNLASPSSARSDDDQTYLLRYQFHQGEIVGYKVEDHRKVILQQQSAKQHLQHGSVGNKRYTVRKVDQEGNAVLDLQIDRVQLTASVDGGDSVEYDTESGESPPEQFRGVDATVGKPHMRVKVSPRGQVQALRWLITNGQRANPTIKEAGEMDIMAVLPEDPVKVGDTWKDPFEVEINATQALKKTIRLQREYTLKAVDGNQATIALRTVVLTPLHDPEQEVQLVSKTPRGTVTFDLARGIVTGRTQKIDKVVVGFAGDDSKSHTVISKREELAPVQVASDAENAPVKK